MVEKASASENGNKQVKKIGEAAPEAAPAEAGVVAQNQESAAPEQAHVAQAPQARRQSRRQRLAAPEAKAPKAEPESKASKKLFGKYALDGIVITDQSLAKYMTSPNKEYPNIFGRRKYNSYYTTHISIIERFVNKLMRGGTGRKIGGTVIRTEGRLQGKKIKVMHIVEDAFDIIYERTKQNPLQVFVSAIEHSVPIEDTTRVRYGGITYNVAVDISSTRRINVTLKNLALAAITKAFQNKKKLSDSIADEIILAASGSPESYAIKKKAEMTRMARSAR